MAAAAAAALASYVFTRWWASTPACWRGRIVVITGGARGLGFALARVFAAEGAVVWLVSRHADQLDGAVERLRATGASAFSYVADITDPASLERMVTAITSRHARIDVVVNNAGVITAMPFANAELEDFRESMDTHFWGPLHVVRATLPWLKRSRGHLINVSSIGGRVGVPHLAPYCAGKFALTGLSQVLRAELAPHRVWVTLATPGLMRTGSIGRVKVRGDHVAEARWFAALAATPLTSQNAATAARQIVDAAARRRATITPGWQARLQATANALAPELMAAILRTVNQHLLPTATRHSTPARHVSNLDLGWAQRLLSTETAAEYNQPAATLER